MLVAQKNYFCLMLPLTSSAERIYSLDPSDNFVYQKHLFAYKEAEKLIHGRVIELGCGEAFGADMLAPNAEYFLAVDKYKRHDIGNGFDFQRMKLPYLKGIADNSFDFAIAFHIIEHLRKDVLFLQEIYRVLKPGGKLILTTPNKLMTIARNPWHIREYTATELDTVVKKVFPKGNLSGVFANEKAIQYYEMNKTAVNRVMKWDILRLHQIIPGVILRPPYNIINRLNRRRLMKKNKTLTLDLSYTDFYKDVVGERCIDLFYLGEK